MARQHIVYKPADRPGAEVLVDGTWLPAEIRMATQLGDGSWQFNVQWRPRGTDTRCIDTFDEHEVRKDTVDRAASRG